MIYNYKDSEYEILARVHQTGSDLYMLKDDGSLDVPVPDCDIVHDDQTIVWYEISGMEHMSIKDPDSGRKLYFTDMQTIDEAKRRIRIYIDANQEEE